MSDKLLFTCRVCGCETDSHPVVKNEHGEEIGMQGVCPEHCEDHDYEYDRFAGDHFCRHCDARPPDDFYYSDDDVCLGGGYVPAALGTPASAMNGNAMQREKDPEAWDNWVRFCASWGHP